MKIYKDNTTGQFFELLYTQSANTTGAPVEATMWFQPLEYDTRGKAVVGLKRNAKEWPRPLAGKLVPRMLTEFTGSARDILPAAPADEPAQKSKTKETGADDDKA